MRLTRASTSREADPMPALKAALVALALVGVLTSCGDAKAGSVGPTTSPTATATPTSTPSSTRSASASASPRTQVSSECDATRTVIPDGSWHGPITMDVRGDSGSSSYADSRGTGELSLLVHNGRVSSGTWSLTWKSHGRAESGGATATVDLTGTVTGTAKGTASTPVLDGTWRIKGIAHVTRPTQSSAPFDETGIDQERLTVRAGTCAQVTATFVASFKSKETAATFSGTAEWLGTRR